MNRSVALLVAALSIACGDRSAADHETLGDAAYADGDYAGALVEYRLELAGDSTNRRVTAKAGAAALRSGDWLAAAQEFVKIVDSDDYAGLAANGLDRVANRAMEDGNMEALQIALDGLMDIRETRALGRFATVLAAGIVPGDEEAIAILPVAAAAATDSRTQDSLIYEYARMLVRNRNCQAAVDVFESLARRNRGDWVVTQSRTQLAQCALRRGQRELAAGHPQVAESWFRRAVVGGGQSEAATIAYLGLGDVMFARGDYFGAQEAYLSVLDRTSPDAFAYQEAMNRLNSLGDATTDAAKDDDL